MSTILNDKMKPVIILPTGLMEREDIAELRKNNFCVVECKEPEKVKFIDPIPVITSRTQIEHAAIKLSRVLLNRKQWNSPDGHWDYKNIVEIFVNTLIEGTPLDIRGTKEEQEKMWQDVARREQIEKMAREEAKAEREAKKKQTRLTYERSLHRPR